MRFVDPIKVDAGLTGEWLREAAELSKRLISETDKSERAKILRLKASCWQKLKPLLSRITSGKCWYCETTETRSDNAVDHFRPKSHYWWLAFDHTNYRFSCTMCNSRREDKEYGSSGGKGDSFPLEEGGIRAENPGDDLKREKPLLLDPCKYGDHKLIWFDETGLTSLNSNHKNNDEYALKVQTSIDLYHLDYQKLSAARRRKFLDVGQICADGDALWAEYEVSGDTAPLTKFTERVVDIYRMIEPSAEHSAAALHATLGLRANSVTARHALGVEDGPSLP